MGKHDQSLMPLQCLLWIFSAESFQQTNLSRAPSPGYILLSSFLQLLGKLKSNCIVQQISGELSNQLARQGWPGSWAVSSPPPPNPGPGHFPPSFPSAPRPTRECGDAHTRLGTGVGGKESSEGGQKQFICSFPILPECGRQVSFGHSSGVPGWAHALGGWDWWQLFYSLFSSSPSSMGDVEGAVTVLKIALVWETQCIFKLGFFSLSLIFFF